ncbi:MAG TPA: hypothetical protein VK943_15340, partial [Arenibaculum sp.]|nr:hypothetical protein [Arenibaculum sp.]
ERQLDRFAPRQTAQGYFHSQDGEWDSNGEALWAYERYHALTGRPVKPAWRKPIVDGARWILRKRVRGGDHLPHAGLLPAGFSAEHLGPNDYYYWDDFWGVAGLRAAAGLARSWGDHATAAGFEHGAGDFARSVDRSLAGCAERLGRPAMPASPYRRLDAGAIGSLAAGYPLALFEPDDERLLDTAAFLKDACFVRGGFFQDMIHSGINAYLTLHVAQVLLRAGDPRAFDLVDAVAALATPTGQWPEAIHPRTLGGCMGDGHHVWAAAEWLMMIRNCFIREEAGRLIMASGIPSRWLTEGSRLRFGPAPTEFGTVTVSVAVADRIVTVSWRADWRGEPPPVEVRLPGQPARPAGPGRPSVSLEVELV